MSEVCVVHLVWAPLGIEPLEVFAGSYREHPAGADHRLLLVFKQFRDRAQLGHAERAVADIPHAALHMPRRKLDLAAYARIAREVDGRYLYFLNSNSELLAPGWLATAVRHLGPGVGMVSASGSYESLVDPSSLVSRLVRGRRFDRFPNPHLRTNAFMMPRDVMLSLDWPEVHTKSGAWGLESGRRSITRQVWARGLEALVVGRDGLAYERDRWFESATFRSGGQSNLLVADNRTRQFAQADAAERRRLAELAWGERARDDVATQAPNRV
jgi:hypothetical protein